MLAAQEKVCMVPFALPGWEELITKQLAERSSQARPGHGWLGCWARSHDLAPIAGIAESGTPPVPA
jgi:hypothetical protein